MPHWYSKVLFQSIQNVKTLRLRYVFQIYPTERWLQPSDRVLNLLRFFCPETNRVSVDSSQILEQQALSLHHGQPSLRSDISETKDTSAVSDYRDAVPLVGVIIHLVRASLNLLAGVRDAWRIPDRKIIVGINGNFRYDLDLSLIERMILHRELSRSISSLQQRRILSQSWLVTSRGKPVRKPA